MTEVLMTDNKRVKRGDVLFRIDPERLRLALAQADAVSYASLVCWGASKLWKAGRAAWSNCTIPKYPASAKPFLPSI
jgi:hypothetical protein